MRAVGCYPEERYVLVYQRDVWFTVGMLFGAEASLVPSELNGHIDSATAQDKLWVKLVGLFSATSQEAKVDSGRNFKMSGMPDGDYLLLTMSGKDILDQRRITLPIQDNRQSPLNVRPKN